MLCLAVVQVKHSNCKKSWLSCACIFCGFCITIDSVYVECFRLGKGGNTFYCICRMCLIKWTIKLHYFHSQLQFADIGYKLHWETVTNNLDMYIQWNKIFSFSQICVRRCTTMIKSLWESNNIWTFNVDTNSNLRYIEKYAEDIILPALTDLSDLRKWYFTERDTQFSCYGFFYPLILLRFEFTI